MHTHPDCLACFMNQAIKATRTAAPGDDSAAGQVAQAWAARLAAADLTQPAPALAAELYPLIARITGTADPYVEHKERANTRILALLPALQERVRASEDPLRTALALAIIGNYIDAGVPDEATHWEEALANEGDAFSGADAYPAFAEAAQPGKEVLILGDNAGEIGLDTLLVRELLARGCKVAYGVRTRPILNDATMADAETVGMTTLCEVLDSGSAAPGAVLGHVSDEFAARMRGADLIVSKGQGNFESLYDSHWPGLPEVYYGFKAKCPVVWEQLGVHKNASLFLREEPRT